MKFLKFFFTTNSLLIIFLINSTYSTICVDYDETNLNGLSIAVDCKFEEGQLPKGNNNDYNYNNLVSDIFNDDNNSNSLFQVRLDCLIPDTELCNKVQQTFDMAGNVITYALTLNEPITVDAKFSSMTNSKELGGAAPTRYILLRDDDNVERFYPQALVKQLGLSIQPAEYRKSDITAEFNSLASWYFPGDNKPIKDNQHDFLDTVIHEMMHGLGFVSSWRSNIEEDVTPNGITPFLVTDTTNTSDTTLVQSDVPFTFLGFYETIFDKFIIARNDGIQSRISIFSDELNKFSGINQRFNGLSDFNNALQNSPQYDTAKKVLSFSDNKKYSLIFMPRTSKNIQEGIILETNIPYRDGSSISHVDSIFYKPGSPDFLMRYLSASGQSLNELISMSGNVTGTAIGPKLLNILSTLGYNVTNNPIKSNGSTLNKNSIVKTIIVQMILYIMINHIIIL